MLIDNQPDFLWLDCLPIFFPLGVGGGAANPTSRSSGVESGSSLPTESVYKTEKKKKRKLCTQGGHLVGVGPIIEMQAQQCYLSHPKRLTDFLLLCLLQENAQTHDAAAALALVVV